MSLETYLRNGGCVDGAICDQAADEIERLRSAIVDACDLLSERKYGSAARSPSHNARLLLEAAIATRA